MVLEMNNISKILLDMLEHESSQARFVMIAAKDSDTKFKPTKELRPLIDLLNHTAEIPKIDFKFYAMEFNGFEEVRAMEKELHRETIDDMLTLFDEGMKSIHDHISNLSDDQLTAKNLKVFYEEGPPKSWTDCIPEITTHLAMHKMQIWMYLKLAGVPVSMFTYYGVPQSH
jgi:hypothetical protein